MVPTRHHELACRGGSFGRYLAYSHCSFRDRFSTLGSEMVRGCACAAIGFEPDH